MGGNIDTCQLMEKMNMGGIIVYSPKMSAVKNKCQSEIVKLKLLYS